MRGEPGPGLDSGLGRTQLKTPFAPDTPGRVGAGGAGGAGGGGARGPRARAHHTSPARSLGTKRTRGQQLLRPGRAPSPWDPSPGLPQTRALRLRGERPSAGSPAPKQVLGPGLGER